MDVEVGGGWWGLNLSLWLVHMLNGGCGRKTLIDGMVHGYHDPW